MTDSESERTKTTFLHGRPRVNPEAQSTALDVETVVLHLSSGRYYTLNRVGPDLRRKLMRYIRHHNTI